MARKLGYWTSTTLLAFALLSGGIAELTQRRETLEGMMALGYPPYFLQILGFWKIVGALALLLPGWRRLKEWAYAGVFFNMTGAAVSHLISHSEPWHVAVTGFLALLTLLSWALRPSSRTWQPLPWSPTAEIAVAGRG